MNWIYYQRREYEQFYKSSPDESLLTTDQVHKLKEIGLLRCYDGNDDDADDDHNDEEMHDSNKKSINDDTNNTNTMNNEEQNVETEANEINEKYRYHEEENDEDDDIVF